MIVGATLAEARYWKGEFSTHDARGMHGYRAKRVFVSPDAHKGRYYREAILILDRSLYKTREADKEIIYLGGKGQ